MDSPAPTPEPPATLRERRAQVALGTFAAIAFVLLAYRAYTPYFAAKPIDAAPRLDVNTASVAKLQQLPGVGPGMAKRMAAHRVNKPFESVEELQNVQGVGPKLMDQLRSHVTAEPAEELQRLGDTPTVSTPGKVQGGGDRIDVNTAGAAELQRIPRIGPAMAEAIIQARQSKPFTTVEELRRVRGIGAKTLESIRLFVTVGQ